LTPLRRGVLRFTGVTLARPDVFGLFRAFAKAPLPQTVFILPKRYSLPPIALPGTMKYQEGGVALASSVGRSEEFVALRDYRRGDPLRHIHWRSWAKTGRPIVKEFEDEYFVRHALVLDTFSDDPRGEVFEEAVSVAASFACTLPTQESLLDLLFVGPQAYCFTAGRGLAHADQMLEILASVRACPDEAEDKKVPGSKFQVPSFFNRKEGEGRRAKGGKVPGSTFQVPGFFNGKEHKNLPRGFRRLEHLVLNHAGVVSGCVCVFLSWDDKRRGLVRKLQDLNVPLLVLVIAEPGGRQRLEPGPLRDEPERFHVLEAGRIEEDLARL
jgi:hypothetical protein